MSDLLSVRPRVAVIGVGTMGAMAMWRLTEVGFDVTGFERFGVPHDRGAHGAESRIYRVAYKEGAEYIPLNRYAHDLWVELNAAVDKSIFIQNGCLYIDGGQSTWLDETIASANEFNVPIVEFGDNQLSAQYPQHRLFGGERAILDLLGGTLRPEQAVLAAVQQAVELGATLHEYALVQDLAPDGTGVSVWVDGAVQRFDYAVVTTGAWTSDFQRSLGFEVTARRLPGTWYPARDPRQFTPERFPVCIRTAGDIEYSGFPCVDGWSVKVMPPVFADTETVAEEVDREIHPRDIAYTRRVASELLNGLVYRPARTGVFIDGFVDRDKPVIDYSKESRRIVGAVGFAGHGFKFSPAVGQLLTDLIGKEVGFTPSPIAGNIGPFQH